MSASKSHRHDGNDFVNRWDFRCRRNDDRVDAAVTVGGLPHCHAGSQGAQHNPISTVRSLPLTFWNSGISNLMTMTLGLIRFKLLREKTSR